MLLILQSREGSPLPALQEQEEALRSPLLLHQRGHRHIFYVDTQGHRQPLNQVQNLTWPMDKIVGFLPFSIIQVFAATEENNEVGHY
jgi:hypothetical protein